MPTNNSGKAPQTQEEYEAARVADRFFVEVKVKAAGIKELAEAQCFAVIVDAVLLLHETVAIELKRREGLRHRQLEIEGLLSASHRSAVNQAEFSLSR